MTQIAAEALAMPVSTVIFELGDTGLPEAPVSGGSQTVASVRPAVHAAAAAARDKLVALAVGDSSSPLRGLRSAAITAFNGCLIDCNSPDRRELMTAVLRHGGREVTAESSGDRRDWHRRR